MTKFETMFQQLKEFDRLNDQFLERGRAALVTVLQRFAEFLEGPPNSCYMAKIGSSIKSPQANQFEAVTLGDGGWFASMIFAKEPPPGGIVGFPFYAMLLDDGWFKLKSSQEGKEFRVKNLDAASLREFFEFVIKDASDFLTTDPQKLAAGGISRPIGFTATLSDK